jgi:hypothetical protein
MVQCVINNYTLYFMVIYVKEVIFRNITGCKERQSLAFIIVWP